METEGQIEYRPIPSMFRRDIYTEFLLARQGDVVLYAITQSDGSGCRWQYEVMIVRRRPAYVRFGKLWPASESLPGNEGFGRLGWNTPTWERAWEIFERECQQRAPAQPRRIHPELGRFRNSIEVQLFRVRMGQSRPTPDGSMLKREPRALEDIPIAELVPA
jgi:hypothetical protein